jgi:hypothetical protein
MPTEIERAALTILMGSRGDHPQADHVGLQCYIRALANDPNEIRSLDLYIWEAVVGEDDDEVPLRELCRDMGYECWQKRWDHDRDAFGAILNHEPRGRRPATKEERQIALMDDAAARLASAIADYRTAGRPEGDQTHTITGMGAPLLRVTTSLAAAVAEYHSRIVRRKRAPLPKSPNRYEVERWKIVGGVNDEQYQTLAHSLERWRCHRCKNDPRSRG